MSNRTRRLLPVALLAILPVACQPAAPAAAPGLTDADRDAIGKTMEAAVAIANRPPVDWNAYVEAYYAPDAMVLSPGGPAVDGREAIAGAMGSYPALTDVKFEQLEIEGSGDWAWVRGSYSFNMTVPDSDEPVPDAGKYIEIWKRQDDGSWRVYRDIYNSDMAPPAPGT
jgi:ketosteroid isomerase-like protein